MANKTYVDSTGLARFLADLKTAYANGTTGFTVKNADYATYAAGENTTIPNTYLKKTDASSTYAPLTRSFGGLTLEADRSVADVNTSLGTITDIKLKGNGDSQATSLTKTNNSVTIDISDYALKSEVAKVMDYKGSATAATLGAKTAANTNNGEVWTVTDESATYTQFKTGFEYVAVVSGDPATLSWVELGKNFTGMASESWVTTNFVGKTAYNADQEALATRIDGIYKPASGTTAASGALVDEITRATAAEGLLDGRLDTLEGDDTTAGSVAKSIKDAIAALDVSEVGGSGKMLTTISETDGKISATAVDIVTTIGTGASATIPASAAAVKSYVDTAIDGVGGSIASLDLTEVGAAGSYIKLISQTDGQVAATAETFDTTLGPASGNGAATNNTAPTSLAVRTAIDAVSVADAETGNLVTKLTPMSNSDIDALFATT